MEIWSKEFKLVKKISDIGIVYGCTVVVVWNNFLLIANGVYTFKFLDFEGKFHVLPTTEKYEAKYCSRPFSCARGYTSNKLIFWNNFLVAGYCDGIRFWNEFGSCVYFLSQQISTPIFFFQEEKTSDDNEPSYTLYSIGKYLEKFKLPHPIHPKIFHQ